MKAESLNKALDMIIKGLDTLDIDSADKVELMLNLRSFLSSEKYKHNVDVLMKEQIRRTK